MTEQNNIQNHVNNTQVVINHNYPLNLKRWINKIALQAQISCPYNFYDLTLDICPHHYLSLSQQNHQHQHAKWSPLGRKHTTMIRPVLCSYSICRDSNTSLTIVMALSICYFSNAQKHAWTHTYTLNHLSPFLSTDVNIYTLILSAVL